MNAVRYGADYGVNLEQCEEWFFEEKPLVAKAPSKAGLTPAEARALESSAPLVPTLRLIMCSGREIVYQGEQAQTLRHFLQTITPHA